MNVEEKRLYQREWYKKNKEKLQSRNRENKSRVRKERRDWFQNLKKNLKCQTCGISDFRVLDFHHLDPLQKDLEVSNMVGHSWSEKNILAEIDKCKVLCANCHRIAHWEENNREIR